MANKNSQSTRKESAALKFVTGGGKERPEPSPEAREFRVVGETEEEPQEVRGTPPPSDRPKKKARKAPARDELAKRELSHRVRVDIHDRLDDEQYRRRKGGQRSHLADIADEALHLGLREIEKRRT